MFELTADIIHFVLSISSIIMHTLGLCLLTSLYRKAGQHKTVHQLLLINLSLTVIIKSILTMIACLTNYLYLIHDYEVAKVVCHYTRLADCTSGLYQYYIGMGFITVDRLLIVVLKARYSIVCTIDRITRLMIITWFVDVIILIVVVVCELTVTNKEVYLDWVDLYLPSILDLVFLILTITSYTVMFFKYASSQKKSFLSRSNLRGDDSLLKVFRKSKFYLSVLLVLSSLILTTIPGLILSGFQVFKRVTPIIFVYYSIGSVGINYLVDGFIYIFMQEKVRAHFVAICCACVRPKNSRQYTASMRTHLQNQNELKELANKRRKMTLVTNDTNL